MSPFRQWDETGTSEAVCVHAPSEPAHPRSDSCEECGSTWNLRVCAECGHVGCCESQHGHNTAHARASGHQVIRSLPLDAGSFTWCYGCRRYL
jgi:uncharacterized UBP type Zn finger protein